jgi:hypothetical protein
MLGISNLDLMNLMMIDLRCSSRALNYPGRLGSFGAGHHHRGRVILGVATLKGRTVFIGYGAMTRYRSKGPRCVGKEE